MEEIDSSSVRHGKVHQSPQCYILRRMPLDIIRKICAEFCLHCRSPRELEGEEEEWDTDEIEDNCKDLYSLGQTCRDLRAQALPFLYHIVWPDLHPNRNSRWFLKTIFRNLRMATEVRFVKFDLGMLEPLWENRPRLVGKLVREASQSLDLDISQLELTHEERQKSINGRRPVYDMKLVFRALMIFIVAYCRNIQELRFCLNEYDPTKEPLSIGSRPLTLRSLRRLTLWTDNYPATRWFLHDISPVLEAAPQLEFLRCGGCAGACRPGDQELVDAQVQSMIEQPWCRSLKELWVGDGDCGWLVASLAPAPSRRNSTRHLPAHLSSEDELPLMMGATLSQLLVKGNFEKLETLVVPMNDWEDGVRRCRDRSYNTKTWDTFYKSMLHLADAKTSGVALPSLREISIPELEEWAFFADFKYAELRARLHECGIEMDKNDNGKPTKWPFGAYGYFDNIHSHVDKTAKDKDGRYKLRHKRAKQFDFLEFISMLG